MTMLTSLKALLFATPTWTGGKAQAAPIDGAADFAQLLDAVGTLPGQAAAAPPVPRTLSIPSADAAPIDEKHVAGFEPIPAAIWQPAALPPFVAAPVAADPLPVPVQDENTLPPVSLAVHSDGAKAPSQPASTPPSTVPQTRIALVLPEESAKPAESTLSQPEKGKPAASSTASPAAPAKTKVTTGTPDKVPAMANPVGPDAVVSSLPTIMTPHVDVPGPQDCDRRSTPDAASTAAPANGPAPASEPVPAPPARAHPTPLPIVAHPAGPRAASSAAPVAMAIPDNGAAVQEVGEPASFDVALPSIRDAARPAATPATPLAISPKEPAATPVAPLPIVTNSDAFPDATPSAPIAMPLPAEASDSPTAPSQVSPHHARPRTAASAAAIVVSTPNAIANLPEGDEPSTPEDAARRVVQNDAQATDAIMAPPVPVAPPPLAAQPVTSQPEASGATSAVLPAVRAAPASRSAHHAAAPIASPDIPAAATQATPPLPVRASVVEHGPDAVKASDAPAMDVTQAASPPIPTAVAQIGAAPISAAQPVPVAPVAPASVAPSAALDTDAVEDVAVSATVAPAKPARAEALSLLQLVRDHMNLRAPRRAEAASPLPVQDTAPGIAPAIQPTAAPDSVMLPTQQVQASAQPIAAAPSAMPTIDLSASLGAQVVDMGVSGQWIDGLVRDIAGLSSNGAQGRFQINADQLGPIQVDIRQGEDGAAISLTVATEAAEQALRQEGDRFKLDAGLSAVRISEMKIERPPHVAETPRADTSGSQTSSNQQQTGGGNGQNPAQQQGQAMGQSSAQSNMHGRGQQRENIPFGHKAGNDAAVLNHRDSGDSADGSVRARYA